MTYLKRGKSWTNVWYKYTHGFYAHRAAGCGGYHNHPGTMLLPALSKAREKARQAVCINNVKQIALVVIMYDNDYGYAPYFRSWIPNEHITKAWLASAARFQNLAYLSYSDWYVYSFLWKRLLPTYVSSAGTLRCPSRESFWGPMFCYLAEKYKQEVKNAEGRTCVVCSNYFVKPFRYEDFRKYALSETAHVSYRVGDKPDRVVVWEVNVRLHEDEKHGQCNAVLAHPRGVTVDYKDGSAEFVSVPNPLNIQVYHPCEASSIMQFCYIMRRDNPLRLYTYD